MEGTGIPAHLADGEGGSGSHLERQLQQLGHEVRERTVGEVRGAADQAGRTRSVQVRVHTWAEPPKAGVLPADADTLIREATNNRKSLDDFGLIHRTSSILYAFIRPRSRTDA